jgi:hypothetical protein
MSGNVYDDILAVFCQNVKTFLQETRLKEIVLKVSDPTKDTNVAAMDMLTLIANNCESVTKLEYLDNYYNEDGLEDICRMTTLKQLTISQMDLQNYDFLMFSYNLMELQIFQSEDGNGNLHLTHLHFAQNCPKLVKFIFDTGP